MISKSLKHLYRFYVQVVMYESCPGSMQTVTMVERILLELSIVNQYLQEESITLADMEKQLSMASLYVGNLLGKNIYYNISDASRGLEVNNLIDTLKSNAKSESVKSYFGL